MDILSLIGRNTNLISDLHQYDVELCRTISSSKFLVIGGAGSLGQAVVMEIFKRSPLKLHVVDLSENNLVELVRDIRSSYGYIDGEFKSFVLDAGSLEFEFYFKNEGPFDYVLNLSALKHVRSEKDPYSLMRMVEVNILNTIKTIELSIDSGVKKYFCVSTDKAAHPVNMMGASKRIMEIFLQKYGNQIPISTARFANVAFSDGSLLHGFRQRFMKDQPIAAPNDVRRYFVTPQESGELCLLSTLRGENGEIYFPKLNGDLNMITFAEIAEKFLIQNGFAPYLCKSEEEARGKIYELKDEKKWPCYFSSSDTTGEKAYEEFYMDHEEVDLTQYNTLGIVKNSANASDEKLNHFLASIAGLSRSGAWTRTDILEIFKQLLPDLDHQEKGKFLDEKM
ncbi:MAG: UDP-N-acetylglucosamine 4,6-dehydratase [Candidatus Marinimicrobia bacterium]|nr:UDP-N-acetylglucosamine 4,6-dehydratase [Candidatus Neomarinimicrobiota bacterium]